MAEQAKPEEQLVIPAPKSNEKYQQITSELRKHHGDLLELEKAGKLADAINNPGLIGDHLTKMRLNCNLLFTFINHYLETLNDLLRTTADARQTIYLAQLKEGKSDNAAETRGRESTRVDEANVKIVENYIQQIKNEYERYNGICMTLQSRLKEFNTERMVG